MTSDFVYAKSLEGFTNVVKEWEGYEKFIPSLEKFQANFLSKVLKTYKPNRSELGYNVLNHADFHIRNLMFKKSPEGAIEDFQFVSTTIGKVHENILTLCCQIDYQICNYASPAIDLIYALYHFLTEENRQTRRDEFITSYYSQFVESLKQFGYMKAPPSLTDLQVELLKNGNLEVLLAVCNAILYYYDLKTMTAEDFDQGEGTKRFYNRLYNTPAYKAMIQKELPRFLHNGFI